ncbi:hypothetical protein [Nocardioides sp. R-C-SC26]|uniref:hypothetical protein n=1 Tax=Nocardioides sp. R-C-SC26 TaxID=2870414 RepID=UPI001E2C1CAE|nr:hypothetical protein [Nocardioides sp. R-C-SC26]
MSETSSTGDRVVSIVLIIGLVLTWALGSFLAFFFLVFLDYCPEATCSVDGAVTASLGTIAGTAPVTVVTVVATIVQLARGRRAWLVALLGELVLIGGFVAGFVAYSAAVS